MRVLENRRHYAGQEDARPVVEWLNRTTNKRATARIGSLVQDLSSLCASARPLIYRVPTAEAFKRIKQSHPKLYATGTVRAAEAAGLLDAASDWTLWTPGFRDYDDGAAERVQRALRYYTFRPYLHAAMPSTNARTFTIELVPGKLLTEKSAGRFVHRGQPTVADLEGQGREQESWAVMHLINLSQAGLVDKVRRCSCGKWLFARTRSSRWCSSRCRIGAYRSTPEWKEKRNQYARDYYNRFHASSRARKPHRKGK